MPRRLLGTAAAAGALLLALTGCVEPNKPTVTSMPPTYTVPAKSDGGGEEPSDGGGESQAPTEAAPDIPAPDPADYPGMNEHNREGAKQAFKYYMDVAMWSYQVGDNELASTLQADSCETCSQLIEEVPDLRENGLLWTELTTTTHELATHDSERFEVEVSYVFTTSEHRRPLPDDSGLTEPLSIDYSAVGGMVWQDDRWLVGALSADWGEGLIDG